MGVGPRWSCGSSSSVPVQYQAPNPNPHKFKIVHVEQIGRHLVVMVNYDGCTTYNGNKVMVYKDVALNDLLKKTFLDPHFLGGKEDPIARFKGDQDGFNMATKFARTL